MNYRVNQIFIRKIESRSYNYIFLILINFPDLLIPTVVMFCYSVGKNSLIQVTTCYKNIDYVSAKTVIIK